MLIVGENINTSRKRIAEAAENQNAGFIATVAKAQGEFENTKLRVRIFLLFFRLSSLISMRVHQAGPC